MSLSQPQQHDQHQQHQNKQQHQFSKEELQAMRDVRRSIWKGGLYGLVGGSVTGWACHYVMTWCQRPKRTTTIKSPFSSSLSSSSSASAAILSRKKSSMRLAFILGGGALGSFFMATQTGKRDIPQLYHIWTERAHHPMAQRLQLYQQQHRHFLTPYQRRVLESKLQQQQQQQQQQHPTDQPQHHQQQEEEGVYSLETTFQLHEQYEVRKS